MSTPKIERVDEIPLLIYWLQKMQVSNVIDRVLPPAHGNRQGLSYGQLGVLFIVYVLYQRSHRLSGMEEWVAEHSGILSQCTGWSIAAKEATDDRLGDLLSELGEEESRAEALQSELGKHLIQAYALPCERVRYDTTSFSVHHQPQEGGKAGGGLLRFGHSKDNRPDLLQFKQGLGTLDPAGVPLYTETLSGNCADDPLYVPAWRKLSRTIGHPDFLFIADSKASALSTRTQIDHEKGVYLFPLPMTGKTPALLCDWVLHPPAAAEPILLRERHGSSEQVRQVGEGFVIELGLYGTLEEKQTPHHWPERWLVTRSHSLATRRQADLEKRLQQTETALARLNRNGKTPARELLTAAQAILERRQVVGLFSRAVTESYREEVRLIGRGRPSANRPTQIVRHCTTQLVVLRLDNAIAEAQQLAGWRIHVTNAPASRLSLTQAIDYYRDEYLVEHGIHRFKHGSLPLLPLFLQLAAPIRGLMLLLFIALQALTLLAFVAQQALAQQHESLSGLVPGNPKMQTARPSAERLLARFSGLHWLEDDSQASILETLTPLQKRILNLLGVPETIYQFVVNRRPYFQLNL